jgi:RHS repeat-associated protein
MMDKRKFLSVFIFLLVFQSLWAGKEKMNARINAPAFSVGSLLTVTDSKFPNVTMGGSAAIKSSVARITLGLDNTASFLNYLGSNTYLKVGVKITHTDAAGNVFSQIREMEINHNATGSTEDRSNIVVKGAHSIIARILYFKNSSNVIIPGPTIPSNAFLEAEIETERYYAFSPAIVPVANHFYTGPGPSTDELQVYWNSVPGAEEYELEYTFVNSFAPTSVSYQYTGSGIIPPTIITMGSTPDFSFNDNSTRIRTTGNDFKISMNYHRGYIFYRVRAIGRQFSNPDLEVFGAWTQDQPQAQMSLNASTLSGFNDFYNITVGHEEDKNWQVTATFAEEGKKKEVISYFDGTDRKRQTITRSNTEYVSLVAETIYDSQGRPAINVLPSPSSGYSGALQYFENFNQSATQIISGVHGTFNRIDFENTSAGSCPIPSGGMYTGSGGDGASQYYSGNNSNLKNQNAYIPDAKQYPFTHNVYAPDNTSTIRYQSGVGDNHKIGSGHETKYVEADPDQEDLDKLFGSEAGYVEKYKKKMVIDANGQISSSYLNSEEKVVATALAGNAPANVNQIPGLNIYPKTSQYIDYNDGNYTSVNIADNGALTFKKKIVPDISCTYNFFYDLTVPQFTDACIPNFCYDCGYDLEITLTDECGAPVYTQSASVGTIQGGPIDFTCGSPIHFSSTGFSPAFNKFLTAGKEYFLTKVLTINTSYMNQYLNHYLQNASSNCVHNLHYFDSLALGSINPADCHMSCSTCSASVLTYFAQHSVTANADPNSPSYDPNYILMTPAQRDQLIDECMKPCKPATLCQTEFEMMQQDMRPTGQYAQYNVTGSTYDASTYALSVFNDKNTLRISTIYGFPNGASAGTPFTPYDISIKSHWRNPEYYNTTNHNFSTPDGTVSKNHYFDANGNVSKTRIIQLPSGSYYPDVVATATTNNPDAQGVHSDATGLWTHPENLKNLKDFIFAYSNNPQWAYSLVKNHPEFNYFLDCDRQGNVALYSPVYTSEQFDADLRSANTMGEADGTTTGINTGQSKWILVKDNTTPDLLNSDPYFKSGAPGGGLYNQFLNTLNNYAGPGVSLKQICAQMYSSAQMYYAPPSCTAAAVFGSTSILCNSVTYIIPTASLDQMWKSYREIYLTEKQKLIMNAAHITACSQPGFRSNYYNGGIGDQNFTPWTSYANYGFFPFLIPSGGFPNPFLTTYFVIGSPGLWPDYSIGFNGFPNQNFYYPTSGRGYYDFGSPSSFYQQGKYANKIRRVPDTQTFANGLAGGASDPTDIMNSLNNTAETEMYLATGQCPIFKRLEFFLSTVAKDGTLFNWGVQTPLVSEPAFTKDLYDAITSCGSLPSASWTPLAFIPSQIGTTGIKIEFYDISGSPNHLTAADIIINNATSINWADVKAFQDIQFNGSIGSTSTFNIKVLSQSGSNPYTLINFNGTTCVPSNCPNLSNQANAQVCKPTQQAFELQSFLSSVLYDYSIPVSSISSFGAINLGDYANCNSANYFTTLVKYPFTTAAITASPSTPISHSVSLINGGTSSTIRLMGTDAAAQVINVDFVFTASLGTGPQDLTGALALSNIQPNSSGAPGYDFTIKANYASGSQTFKVLINYPAGLCGNSLSNTCRFYNLKTCDQFVSGSCANNNNYKTNVQLVAFLNEVITYPLSLATPVANLTTYNSLLQSQINVNNGYLVTPSLSNTPNTATLGTYDYSLTVQFYNNHTPLPCAITLTTNSSVAPLSMSPNSFTFSNLFVIGGPSGHFTIQATDGPNTFAFEGIDSCLTMENCLGCDLDSTIYKQDFESYNGGPPTGLNFSAERFDLGLGPVPINCNFLGFTCSPYAPQLLANFGDLSIINTTGCMGFPDHTPAPGTKYLQSYVWHPSSVTPGVSPASYVIPWKNKAPGLTTVAGKTYSITFWYNYTTDDNEYRIDLIVNDGTNDLVLSTKTVDVYNPSPYNAGLKVWEAMSAKYVANSTSTTFKIKVSPILSPSGAYSIKSRIAIDDIVIKEVKCGTETGVPLPPDSLEDDCVSQLTNIALTNAKQEYNNYINNVKNDFINAYTAKCYQSLERMSASYQSSEGHYTLYYYDQAGNLIRTVPPEGVEPVNLAAVDPISGLTYSTMIRNDRDNKTKTVFTNHRMITRYEYNSLNQLVRQQMPDHADADLYTATSVPSLPPGLQVVSMDFASSLKGFLIGNNGSSNAIYVTNDGGITWTPATGLTTGDIIDIDYAGGTAYGIVSDGSIVKSSSYNSISPVWQIISLPGSSTMKFTDIEFYSATDGYITGKNGLLLRTSDGGTTWSQVPLGTTNDINKIDFKNDGSGTYGILVGNSGTVFYITPANLAGSLWYPFPNLNNGIDLLNVSIAATGNGASTYMNAIAGGTDKNTPNAKGTLINLIDVNGPFQAVNNLYQNANSLVTSKVQAVATTAYVTGGTSFIDVYYGGIENSVSPANIFGKLQYSSLTGVFTPVALTISGQPVIGINDLIINGIAPPYKIEGVTQNGKYLEFSSGATNAVASDINTTGITVNTSPCNRINVDPSNPGIGLISANVGGIFNYNNSAGFTSQMQTLFSWPSGLNSITASKDGSGIIYAVGNAGGLVYSKDFGSSWVVTNTGLSSINFYAAKYLPLSPAKIIIAGDNGYKNEIDVNTNNFLLSAINIGGAVYRSIDMATGNNTQVFLAGKDASNNAIIHVHTLGSNSAPAILSIGGTFAKSSLNKIQFSSVGQAYAVGDGGTIIQSLNNGSSFNSINSGVVSNLNDVVISDQFTAYAFGNSSTVLKTTDDGASWQPKGAPASSNINAVYNFGNGNMLAAGSGASNLFSISDQGGDYSSRFYYDALGRLIISQNSKQFNKPVKAYSYTIYDAIGRIKQVGEIAGGSLSDPSTLAGSQNGVIPIATYTAWLTTGSKSEVTSTFYDDPVGNPCSFTQDNLRKRVAATYIDNDDNLGNGYSHATYYTYDIHGNVKSLLQENPLMPAGQTCKKIDYDYDLISGKVNMVSYQDGSLDAYYHKYDYDADNRITNVYTSKDGVDWQQDAKYFYYLHGPLARTEIGNDKVQGMDYAYTIQGWLKGVNSIALNKNNDIGKDGDAGNLYNSTLAGLNQYMSYDAMGYALDYFGYNGASGFISDYQPIDATKNASAIRFNGDVTGNSHFALANSLFNGNIMAMATSIYTDQPLLVSASPKPQLATYKYDQLNRINQMNSTQNITTNQWGNVANNNYRNEFTYDANGNILTQKRYDAANTIVDDMTYQYHIDGAGKKHSNRLYHVNDAAASGAATDDIDDEGVFTPAPAVGNSLGQINSLNNYSYDEIGNLVKDNQEGISNIDWTVYGKIKQITRTAISTAKNLVFEYDAAGNRVSKTSYGNGQPANLWTTTYYVRDAQGNVMATYEYKPSGPGGTGPQILNLNEHHIFGSSRLGMRSYFDTDNLNSGTSPYNTAPGSYSMALQAGNISYELGNHLGNVLTVVSDRKLAVPTTGNPNLVDHYVADILSSNDYYPFGMGMSARKYVSPSGVYRYGFNGQEKDDEVAGSGNSYDFGARIYDSRIGRWYSVDPKCRKFSDLSPFNFGNNNPIYWIDPDGGTVTPGDPVNAKFLLDVFKYENSKNYLSGYIKTAEASQINYIIVFQTEKGHQDVNLQWNSNFENQDPNNQQVIVTITVDSDKSFPEQIAQAQSELGKAAVLISRIENSDLGFQKTGKGEDTYAGLDYEDIAGSQEGGIKAATSHGVPASGTAKDYQDKNVSKGGDKAKQEWVSNYKENKQKKYKELLKKTGEEGLNYRLPANMVGKSYTQDVTILIDNDRSKLRGYLYKRNEAGKNNNPRPKSVVKLDVRP